MSRRAYKRGKYTPVNTEKYVGKHIPTYRSSWELRVCNFFDMTSVVLEWASEPVAIQYTYRSVNGQPVWGLYIPDYYVKMKTQTGIKSFLVEVKPHKQCIPPVPPKTNRASSLEKYRSAQVLYVKNQSKWEYAKRFCVIHGMEFKVITEKDIY